MSGTSSYEYIDSTGVIVPDTTDLLTTVKSEYTGVFGSSLETDASTRQGVLIVAETAARTQVLKNNALLANQINPNQAGGIFLDAIAALTALVRAQDTYSIYEGVILAGVATTPVPINTQATTANGDVYETTSAVTIGSSGTATVSMQAVKPGPIIAPSGTLTLYSSVLGLETIIAPSAGTVGTLGQSDVSFRTLRRNTLAKQSVSINGSIVSELYLLNGVVGVQFLENNTAASATIETITLVANSIWVCVDGGFGQDIGNTILLNKSGGCNWNGSQSVSCTDNVTGQAYTVKYEIPTLVPFMIRATVKQGSFVGQINDAVSNAILAFSNNTVAENTQTDLGINGFVLGGSVSPFEIAGAILAQVPGCYVQKVEVSTVAAATYQTTEWVLNINQKASISVGNIDVIVVT
jgi:hypothetical protein